jgi:hypothetical protein
MKYLTKWREFGVPNAPSIKDSFEAEPYEGMERIANYLDNSGEVTICAASGSVDVLTQESISDKRQMLTDGEYAWNNTLSYYVRKYNLRLPKEFEDKVLGTA